MSKRDEYPTDPATLNRYPTPKVIGAHDPELAGLIEHALKCLSPREQQWAEMASAGMTPTQIAKEWGVKSQTVNTIRVRAIAKLKEEQHGLYSFTAEGRSQQRPVHPRRNMSPVT